MRNDIYMQEVACHLQIYAHNHYGVDRDAYARSAYNRYYYACFLLLRDLVSDFNPDWTDTPHKSYPELLNGKITTWFKHERYKAKMAGDNELCSMISTSLSAIPKIANIIKTAYSLRVIADYNPEMLVEFSAVNRFSLNNIEITQVHIWQENLFTLVSDLRSTWQQFNA